MRISNLTVICLALAAVAPAFADSDRLAIRSGADLITYCDASRSALNADEATAFCNGFVSGAFQFYQAWVDRDPAQRFVCIPEPYPQRSVVVKDMVAWAKANPESQQGLAVDMLFQYLGQRFECK